MALLCYMKPVGGLPDPRGSLSSSIPTQVIAEANKEVQKQLELRAEVKVVLTSCIALLYVQKLLNMPVNMVQLQLHKFSCRLIFVSVFKRRKKQQRENLTDKYLYRRKFPDLR